MKKIICIILSILIAGIMCGCGDSMTMALEKGDYAKAFSLAESEDERISVLVENDVAMNLEEIAPLKFEVKKAYYRSYSGIDDRGVLLLLLSMTSMDGEESHEYMYFGYIEQQWKLVFTAEELDENQYSNDIVTYLAVCAAKDLVKENSCLSVEALARINNLIKEEKLSDIKIIIGE